MTDEENPPAAAICSMPHCDEPAGNAYCTGTTPHALCDSCFCGYARAQCETVLGAFEQERIKPKGISAPGELPCFMFLTNQCDCTSIPNTTLARVLSTDADALEKYEEAKRRLVGAQHDRDQAEADAAHRQHEQQDASPVERLRRVVVDALSRGGYVACPACGQHGQKNGDCMHMTCPCGTNYCYCCGRPRGEGPDRCTSDGTGCDRGSAFLENHPGWNNHAINDEPAGLGALHEFHRRRMAYFLRQVKADHPPNLWEQLRREHPNILDGKPTDGRHIRWDEIDTAEPPLFGGTTVTELQWRLEGQRACVDIVREERQRQEAPMGPHKFSIREHPFVAFWIAGFSLAIILMCARITSDSDELRTIGNLLIAVLIGSGSPTLAMWLVDKFASNRERQYCCIHDVQCCRGRNQELPYLASTGRWSRWRETYWYLLFGGIVLASVCLANKQIPGFLAFGATILSAVIIFYGFLTILVNKENLPQAQPLRREFRHSMTRLSVFGGLLSIGIGLLAGYDSNSNGGIAGIVFLAIGLAGALGELMPRMHQAMRGQNFTLTPNKSWLILSYFFCLGLAIGSLMVGLTESDKVLKGGKIMLIVVTVLSALCFCWVQCQSLVRI